MEFKRTVSNRNDFSSKYSDYYVSFHGKRIFRYLEGTEYEEIVRRILLYHPRPRKTVVEYEVFKCVGNERRYVPGVGSVRSYRYQLVMIILRNKYELRTTEESGNTELDVNL